MASHLTEELVRQGHEVTLFASGDSVTQARLIPGVDRSLRLSGRYVDSFPLHLVQMENVRRRALDFDVIHFHSDYPHFPISRAYGLRQMTTLHGRLDLPELVPLYREYVDMPVVSISDAQRAPLPFANWQGTVHHGIPPGLFQPSYEKGKYLAFLGRISPEKRVDRAIEIATRAGITLKIAAKVDKADQEYYDSQIKPLIDSTPGVEFIGEIGETQKQSFLANAIALLFPIDWPEPFGLVMIEAMACGTPVIAYRKGSVSEVMNEGVSGFIVESIDEAVAAVGKIDSISRAGCRAEFEKRFTVRRMAHDYLELYAKLGTGAERRKSAGRTSVRIRGYHSDSQPVLRASEFLAERQPEAGTQAAR